MVIPISPRAQRLPAAAFVAAEMWPVALFALAATAAALAAYRRRLD
jgi:hypothetical protein